VTSPRRPNGWVGAQGHYAGLASRFLAYGLDVAVSTLLFTLGLAAVAFIWSTLTGHQVSWSKSDAVIAVVFAGWSFLYFGYSWATSGKTVGMAALGVRVVRADGVRLDPWRGVLRALVFPLSFLFFGLGFVGIVVQRERRALHDLIAGSAVIYAWDARAARLRLLAREAELESRSATSPRGGDAPASMPAKAGHDIEESGQCQNPPGTPRQGEAGTC
jgi:uncharacterized RDD family membrane protein YckC